MRRICLSIMLPLLLVLFLSVTKAASSDEPDKFFRDFAGLNEEQISAIRSGKAIAKVIESPTPDEVYVFGSVYVEATPESYLKLASDIEALRNLPSYLAIESFSDPPRLSDLEGFTLNEQDIAELKGCKIEHCQFQLPKEAIEDFQRSINWSTPDTADRVNRRAQQLALQALQEYMQGGNSALGAYRDKKHPAEVAETFGSLIARFEALPVYLPELNEYLLDYPRAKSENV
jgi:hypothetical protein